MSILENVLFGAAFHGQVTRRDRAEYAKLYLDRVGLWEEVKDRLHDGAERLSGSQQQRLCLVRTLATKPQALLLDELCSALDPAATRHIEEHDHVLFMYEGELIEAGPADQVFVSPKSELARCFISGQFG